jgi:hypothetical protein
MQPFLILESRFLISYFYVKQTKSPSFLGSDENPSWPFPELDPDGSDKARWLLGSSIFISIICNHNEIIHLVDFSALISFP